MRLDVWHNVMWARYKARVFSALHRLALAEGEDVHFVQMTETERARTSLGGVELSYHRYPYELLYEGSVETVPPVRSALYFFWRALTNRADFVLIAQISAVQNWAQLLGLVLRRTPRGVFCDSTAADKPNAKLKHLAKRIFLRRCHLVLCYGERSRAYALLHGADPSRVMIRYQAAALPDGYRAEDVPALRAARRSATPRILFTGRLSYEKNLGILLEAFAGYAADRPAAQLRLVGDGVLRAELEAKVAALGIADQVVFTGGVGQDALADEYLAATCMVLPSISEPWGLVVNEALSYGCPVVVSTACGCSPELVIPARTGFGFEPADADALRRRLVEVETIFADVATSARACLDHIAAFSPDATAAQIMAAVRATLARGT